MPKIGIKKSKHKELVEVKPPIGSNSSDSVNIRVLSYDMLKGMVSEFSESKEKNYTTIVYHVY